MIKAIYRDGKIEPLGDVPAEWQNEQALEARAASPFDVSADTDDWIYERGAFANYQGEMPPHVRQEIDRRLAELHALGPMEFEPGEREEMQRLWAEMDELGRQEMQRIVEGKF